MVLAFQIIITIIMVISFMGAFIEDTDNDHKFTSLCIAAMAAFIISGLLL